MAKLRKRGRVALLVPGWNQYGRGIIEGAWHYAQRTSWILDLQPVGPDGGMQMPEGWRGDGIIAIVHSSKLAADLRRYRVPVVNVSGAHLGGISFSSVTPDADAVVGLAVEHLRQKGIRRIAFCGEPHRKFLDFWTKAYERAAIRFGFRPHIYAPKPGAGFSASLLVQQRDRARWLAGLEPPLGVIGWDTITCRHVANACELARLEVPNRVAIISLSTEDLLGQTIHPPISGVDIPVKRIGYEAANLLDRLIDSRGRQPERKLLQPLGITARQSTDIFECDDPRIRQAMQFIKEHASFGIDVRHVLRAVPVARRTLERQFAKIIGHSPAEEIRRTKLEGARQLLISTDMPVSEIAEACGFAYVERMIPLFARHHGDTPAAFRRNLRRASPPSVGQGGKIW